MLQEMLIDAFLPEFHFSERHQRLIAASPDRVYEAARKLDMSRSHLIGILLRARSLGTKRLGGTLEDLLRAGFMMLDERAPEEFVLGIVGRFWTLTGGIERTDDFIQYNAPGRAKAAWNFHVLPSRSGTLLSTETRIWCTDARALRSFRLYWTVVRPFSGLVRRAMLRGIDAECRGR